MVYRSFLLVVVGTMYLSGLFSQSCIVYKKESEGLYIGVDSRITSYSMDKDTRRVETSELSICKIERVDSIMVAVTGHGANLAMDEAKYLLRAEPQFEDAITRFTKSFGQKLADILETERLTNPGFKTKYKAGEVLGGALFAYYQNGVLKGRMTRIILLYPPNQKASISTENVPIDSIGATGSTKGIRTVIFKNDIWKKGPVHGINNLINIEKFANPTQFDGNVDVLFLSNKNEMKWVQSKKCF